MLRISRIGPGRRTVTLRLEGRIIGPWVGEVREACEKYSSEGHAIKLDLSEVSFVDQNGVNQLKNLAVSGVTLVGCSLFVEEQLKTAADSYPLPKP